MMQSIVLAIRNAKYIHAAPAPWALAAGVQAYAPECYDQLHIVEGTINQEIEHMLAQIVALRPDFVGLSCYIWNITQTLLLAKQLRAALPHCQLALGGPEVSFCPVQILTTQPHIDFVLCGEGEESLPALLRCLHTCAPVQQMQAIAGVCLRLPTGELHVSPPAHLHALPPSPLRSGYAQALHGRIAYIETSRGCPYHCAFCLSGRTDPLRCFPLTQALEDLVTLANTGTQTIKFVDRTFNANSAHCNAILTFLLAHFGKEIPHTVCVHFEIAADILTSQTLQLLSRMPKGAVQLEIGIQSFHAPTLSAISRKTDIPHVKENIRRLCSFENMHIHIDLIAGLPLETWDIFADGFHLAYGLQAHALQLGFLKVLQGSSIAQEPVKYPCVYALTPPYEVQETPWISAADLQRLRALESAVDRVYNSQRFCISLAYLLEATKQTPFALLLHLGERAQKRGLGHGTKLDDYIAFFLEEASCLDGVDALRLRDCLVEDRLCSNSAAQLPACLYRAEPRIAVAHRLLEQSPQTARPPQTKRALAMLYSTQEICYVDYLPHTRSPLTKRWQATHIPLSSLPLC